MISDNSPVIVASKTYNKCSERLVQALNLANLPSFDRPSSKFFWLVDQIETCITSNNDPLYASCTQDLIKAASKTGITLEASGIDPQEKFRDALEKLCSALPPTNEVGRHPAKDAEELSPAEFKEALKRVGASFRADQTHPTRTKVASRKILSSALQLVWQHRISVRRIYVVESNFDRLFSYLIELYDAKGSLFEKCGHGKKINTSQTWILP